MKLNTNPDPALKYEYNGPPKGMLKFIVWASKSTLASFAHQKRSSAHINLHGFDAFRFGRGRAGENRLFKFNRFFYSSTLHDNERFGKESVKAKSVRSFSRGLSLTCKSLYLSSHFEPPPPRKHPHHPLTSNEFNARWKFHEFI